MLQFKTRLYINLAFTKNYFYGAYEYAFYINMLGFLFSLVILLHFS